MKIKSYRAHNLREALVQIKQELGEDALVLETKQVRAGGFFGVGARELVEVRVAPSPRKESAPKKSSSAKKVNLRDDSSATPSHAKADTEARSSATFAALAARTYTNNNAPRAAAAKPDREPAIAPALPVAPIAPVAPVAPVPPIAPGAASEGIELAETAPRIVHRHSNQKSAVNDKDSGTSTNGQPASHRGAGNNELARLRAELREVKFSLEAFASRSAIREEMKAQAAFENDPAIYDSPQYETYLELTAAGLAPTLAREAARKTTVPNGSQGHTTRSAAREALIESLPSWVRFAEAPLAVNAMAAFVGPTGVGKTTTIAKLAARIALRARRRVELITLDTYRIAAVEQLKTYAEIIGAGCHVARSVVELDALTQRFMGEATVLIDTTGRSPHDLADQLDLADYLRGNATLLKCLVLSATTHPADAQLVTGKFALYGANRLVLTKLDETVQAGATIGIAAEAELPLIYLSAGQRVPEDLERATPLTLADYVVGARGNAVTR